MSRALGAAASRKTSAPKMEHTGLLGLYCGLILLASLAGGWLPIVVRLTHTRLQVATSFVAGLMLGVGLLHLVPHAWQQLRSSDRTVAWLLGGFLVMFFIQRFFHFHHHDVPEDAPERERSEIDPGCGHHHQEHGAHSHAPGEDTLAEKSAHHLSWAGAALGLTMHTLIDGIALAASVEVESRLHGAGWLMGFGTFLVIILHKPFDAMTIGTLMAAGGWSRTARHFVNGFFALSIPVGVFLFYVGVGHFDDSSREFVGAALAFAGGTFLCIAASDLLPELQFHAHDRGKLSMALVAGLALAILIGKFERSGHDHHHSVPVNEVSPAMHDCDSHRH